MDRIVVIGGGYAGINIIESLKKKKDHKTQIILIDKNEYHFKKVKLFKRIVSEESRGLKVPLKDFCGHQVEFIQGEVFSVDPEKHRIQLKNKEGQCSSLQYTKLIIAVGSVINKSKNGGMSLTDIGAAKYIREFLLRKIESKKIKIAIVGAGMTGIETITEINHWLQETVKKRNSKSDIELYLINNKERLLSELPVKVSNKLENRLRKQRINIFHKRTVKQFENKKLLFNDGTELEVDTCIWTVGLKPNPCLQNFGLPLTDQGKLIIDNWYAVAGTKDIYAIGDCVQAIDNSTVSTSAMSCKEAISQAQQLAKIIKDDLHGNQHYGHNVYPPLLCMSLGPKDGFVWFKKWKFNIVFTGRIAARVREYTWNLASLFC